MIRLDSKKFIKIRSYKYINSDKYFKRSNLGLDLVRYYKPPVITSVKFIIL